MSQITSPRVWTVAEAKSRLSEILRLAESEGPQHIGAPRRSFVLVSEQLWRKREPPRNPLGQWLIEEHPARDRPRSPRPT